MLVKCYVNKFIQDFHSVWSFIYVQFPQEHPRHLIPELCRLFYDLGWMTGSGGALSIKEGLVVKWKKTLIVLSM